MRLPIEPGGVLLLHGAGLDPRLFDPVIAMLRVAATAPLRAPYADPSVPPSSVVAQAGQLAEQLAEVPAPVTVVGVSGGATIAIALALRNPSGVAGIIAHEPLIGPLAADLHAAITASAERLARTPGTGGVVEFLTRLVGADTWAALAPEAVAFAERHADVVRAEAPLFAAFTPTADELAGIRTPLVVSIGGRSHPRRAAAAARLATLAAARPVCLEGAGHLAHVECPAEFAALVGDRVTAWSGA